MEKPEGVIKYELRLYVAGKTAKSVTRSQILKNIAKNI
jgi:hypothetical protein